MDNFKCDKYSCSDDPLEQIYPTQNMCVLTGEIPKALRDLPYGMYPTCDIYYTNRFSYNKRWNWFPNAVFTPRTPEEVQYVLGQFIHHKLRFFVRSGGHCYEQVIPHGYILDLRNFNEIIPDIDASTVYIGAGSRLGDVISALGEIDYLIPTGTCPSVGVAGLALGGGIGMTERKFGLTCDAILSITLVTADNKIITVSEHHHPDLFWALRGAGNNSYGVVLGFTFKMYHVPVASILQLRWDWDPKVFFEVYEAWQTWVTTLPSDITAETVFKYKDGRVRLSMNAMKIGAEEFTEWESVFRPLKPDSVELFRGNYASVAAIDASNYTFPFSKAKSKILFKPLTHEGIGTIIDWMALLLSKQCQYEAFWGFGCGNPGAIIEGDTAFFPRTAFGIAIGFIYWPHLQQQSEAVDLINQSYRDLEPFTSPYSYSNLVDYDLGPEYLNAYYGTHVPRLIKIKNIYDPKDIFRWRQGIPTRLPCA